MVWDGGVQETGLDKWEVPEGHQPGQRGTGQCCEDPGVRGALGKEAAERVLPSGSASVSRALHACRVLSLSSRAQLVQMLGFGRCPGSQGARASPSLATSAVPRLPANCSPQGLTT